MTLINNVEHQLADALSLSGRIHKHAGTKGPVHGPAATLQALHPVALTHTHRRLIHISLVVGKYRHQQLVGVVGVAHSQWDRPGPIRAVTRHHRQAHLEAVQSQIQQQAVRGLTGVVERQRPHLGAFKQLTQQTLPSPMQA